MVMKPMSDEEKKENEEACKKLGDSLDKQAIGKLAEIIKSSINSRNSSSWKQIAKDVVDAGYRLIEGDEDLRFPTEIELALHSYLFDLARGEGLRIRWLYGGNSQRIVKDILAIFEEKNERD